MQAAETALTSARARFAAGDFERQDWDFADTTRSETSAGVHGLWGYTSKFIPQIPRQILRSYGRSNGLVLDVFAGSGTTLVEASVAGLPAVGVDISEIACLLTKVKGLGFAAESIERDARTFLQNFPSAAGLQKWLYASTTDAAGAVDNDSDSWVPSEWLKRLYRQPDLDALMRIRMAIGRVESPRSRAFLNVCFLSIARRCSLLSSNFGNDYVTRKNAPREAPIDAMRDAVSRFLPMLRQSSGRYDILLGDARCLPLPTGSVDLIVTHPPYFAAVPYAEYLRLEIEWLGQDSRRLDERILGGKRGRADAYERFEAGTFVAFAEMKRVLRPDGLLFNVIGPAKFQGRQLDLADLCIRAASKNGLDLFASTRRSKKDTTHAWHDHEFIQAFGLH